MTILVTGGAGFIGTNFIIDWFKNGKTEHIINLDVCEFPIQNVRNLDAISEQTPIGMTTFIRGDVGDHNLIRSIFEKYAPRIVVNFAAKTHVDHSIENPVSFIQTNVNAQSVFLEEVRSWLSKCHEKFKNDFRFIHVSTDEVYGSLTANAPRFKEDSPFLPNSPYAASKAAMDMVVRSYWKTYGFPVIVTHCSNNFGKYQFEDKFIPKMISSVLMDQPMQIYGDGTNIRDWISVSEHCTALRFIIQRAKPGTVLNIGSGDELTNNQAVDLILDLYFEKFGQDRRYLKTYVEDRKGHDFRYGVDTHKIFHETNWTSDYDFIEGLRETFNWYVKQI